MRYVSGFIAASLFVPLAMAQSTTGAPPTSGSGAQTSPMQPDQPQTGTSNSNKNKSSTKGKAKI
jgi:hypothetical protein